MKHFYFVVFFIITIYSYAQERISVDYKKQSLKYVLLHLEQEFELKFSYKDESVENKYFTFSADNISLQTILTEIQETTNIIFEKVNSRYYVIRAKQKGKYNSICAYILDDSTSESLEKAEIINLNQGTGTTTNKNGYFELHNVSELDTISIHYLGFKTLKVTGKTFIHKNCKNIRLSIFNESLSEVIIKEYVTQGILKSTDGAIKVLPNNLQILPGLPEPDVLESLQTLPGIQSPNETASGLHVRGGTPDQNLILWDGIKIYHSGHFFGTISAFNPYITEEVKVFKNGSKAKYGNRISGTIDISSKKEIPSFLRGGVGFNMTHADAYLKAPLFNKKVGIVASARRSFTDVINTFTYEKLTKKVFQNTRISKNENDFGIEAEETSNNFYFSDFNVKVISDTSKKDRLTFSSLFVNNELDYSAVFSDEDFTDNTTDKLKIKNNGVQFNWKRDWSRKFQHIFSINSSNYDLNYTGINEFDEIGTMTNNKTNELKELELELSSNYRISNKSAFEFGYQYATNEVSFLIEDLRSYLPDFDFSVDDRSYNITHAFFTEYKYNNPNKILLNLGIRANTFSVTNDFFIEPRLNIETYLNKNLTFNISSEVKNQSLSQIIEFVTLDFGLENQLWALADEDNFPVLKSKQVSSGFGFNKNNWNISIDGYYKKIKGLSSFTRGFSTSTQSFSNGGSSTNYGLELLVKKRIKNYRTWISYSLARSDFQFKDLNDGNKFAGNFDIRHSFNWSHTYKLNDFDFSIGFRYREGKPFTEALRLVNNEEFFGIEFDRINSSKLPDYHRMDFSGTYSFDLSKKSNLKGKVGLSILNIYGRKNLLNTTYFISQESEDQFRLVESNQNSLGFTPNLVFRLNF